MDVVAPLMLDWSLLFDLTLFMVFVVLVAALIGFLSQSMALGVWGAFVIWAHLAIETDNSMFMAVLYLTLTVVILFMAFRVYGFAVNQGGNG